MFRTPRNKSSPLLTTPRLASPHLASPPARLRPTTSPRWKNCRLGAQSLGYEKTGSRQKGACNWRRTNCLTRQQPRNLCCFTWCGSRGNIFSGRSPPLLTRRCCWQWSIRIISSKRKRRGANGSIEWGPLFSWRTRGLKDVLLLS